MLRAVRYFFSEGRWFVIAVCLVGMMPLLPEYGAPVLAMAGLFAAYRDARSRNAGIQIGTLGKLLLLYIAYMGLGITYSRHPGNSLATFMMWVVMFFIYLTLTTILNTKKRIRIALFLVAAAAGIIGCIACVQYMLRDLAGMSSLPNQFWFKFDNFFFRHFPMDIDLTMGANRAAGTFNNPNIMSEYFVMTIPLVGFYGFYGKRTNLRMLGRCFTIAAVFGAVVSFSRGAYIALLSMLLLIIVTNLRKLSPFIMCLIAAVSLIPEAVIGRFLSIGEGGEAIFERLDAWEVAIQAIVRSPLIGLGPGVSNFWEYLNRMGISAPHAHNVVLQILVEGGFVALFLMCLVATRLLQDSLGLLNRSRQSAPIGLVFLIFAIAFVVHGMVEYPFLSPKLVGTFCMVLGFFDTMSNLYLPSRLTPLSKLPAPITKWMRAKFSRKE